MIVECGVCVIFTEILGRISSAPFLVHHLHVKSFICGNAEICFSGADTLESCGVIVFPHGVGVGVGRLLGFIDDFEHADGVIVGVCVDDVGHPFEELVRTFILIVDVEAGTWSFLPDRGQRHY